MTSIFHDDEFGEREKARLDLDGHCLLPGLLTHSAQANLTAALSRVEELRKLEGNERPNRYAAEHDDYLASLIAHPQLIGLARAVLGDDIRYDHCVSLNRPSGNGGIGWHSHSYAEDNPALGFLRIFFYVNGFEPDDGGLKTVPGSHHYRDPKIHTRTDDELRDGWLVGKTHPLTGKPLKIEPLTAPEGSVALMWTHAAHAVSPRREGSATRWAVVYAYRNPGESSRARWISEEFEKNPPPGTDRLMSLY